MRFRLLFSFLLATVLFGVAAIVSPPAAHAQTLQWEKRYNNWPTYNVYRNDNPRAVATDAQGNVYVTGAVYAGSSGSLYILYNQDWATIKYSPTGQQLWLKKYVGGTGYAEPYDLAVDAQGNCYVTGYADEPTGDKDEQCVTIKYDANGNQTWVRAYDTPNAPVDGDEEGRALAIDAQGNLYVAGRQYTDNESSYDAVLLKYTGAGALVWAQVYESETYGGGFDRFRDIAFDGAGNVIVCGDTESKDGATYTNYDILAAKYTPAGAKLWSRHVNGAANGWDEGDKIVVDAANNIYVAGTMTVIEDNYDDWALVKYNAAGTLQWSRTYGGDGGNSDRVAGVAVDKDGNAVVAGTVYNSLNNGYYNMRVAKYSAAGAVLWASEYNDDWDLEDQCESLVMDKNGDVYLSGASDVGFTPDNEDFDTNISVVKYNGLTGGEVWRYSYGGQNLQLAEDGSHVSLDPAGNVVVSCSSDGYDGTDLTLADYATFKLTNGVGKFAPRDISVGADNKARITWTRNGDRQVAAWTLNAQGTAIETGKAFTAPAGFQPRFIATGDDNKPRILLTSGDGKATLWRLNAASTVLETAATFGTATGYTARDFAIGPDGKSYIAWENNDTHKIALWRISATGTTLEAGFLFGPYAELSLAQIAVGADNKVRFLWKNRKNGQATVWRLNAAGSAPEAGKVFNEPSGYDLSAFSIGGDNKVRLLWRKTENNALALWTLNVAGTAIETGKILNPLATGTPYQLATGRTDNKSRVLWTLPNNRAALWTIGDAGTIETGAFFGPY